MPSFLPEPTQDGSSTYKNLEFNETYHSSIGAYTEALCKHVVACKVDEIAKERLETGSYEPIKLLDVCFGLAYNSGVAIEKIWEINPEQKIEIIGLENDSKIIAELDKLEVPESYKYIKETILNSLAEKARNVLVGLDSVNPEALAESASVSLSSSIFQLAHAVRNLDINILLADARLSISELQDNCFDAIFFDPFSPKTCPVLWTEEFISEVVRKAKYGAYISTYSSARIAKDSFLKAGCELFEGPKLNRRNGGVLARKSF